MRTAVQKLLDVFSRLGLPVATDKLGGPTTRLVLLGFELDMVAWEIRLLRQKLEELKELISQWVGGRTCSRMELESLVGKLGHDAQVVPPGKTFTRRLFEPKAAMGQARGRIRLNNGFRSDIMWWATFLETWNGVRIMKDNSQQVNGSSCSGPQVKCGSNLEQRRRVSLKRAKLALGVLGCIKINQL